MTDAERTLLLIVAAQVRQLAKESHPISGASLAISITELMTKIQDEAAREAAG